MVEVRLQGPGVRPSASESISGCVSEPMEMRLYLEASRLPGPLDHRAEA
jgi:hypothetical protein